jgi:1-acyl-sn-glycerol-3-phosphate acyltransferase
MATARAVFILTKIAVAIPPVMVTQAVLMRIAPSTAKKFSYTFCNWLNRTMGVRITVEGEPVKNQPCLMISNHASWQDILLLGGTTPVSFVAKHEVSTWPVIGTLARMARTVFVDRSRRHAAGDTKNDMQSRLENGDTLVLFPEGTTSDGSHILPFKTSLFGASQLEVDGKHVKVQSVTIAYQRNWGIPMGRATRNKFTWPGDVELGQHLWNNLKSGPLDVTIRFHPPTDVDEVGGRKVLARVCEQQVKDGLAQLLANCN